jgi:hypothetical protein
MSHDTPRDEALSRPEFERLTVEQAMEVLERYPNLRAILQGTVSGNISEWPMIRAELQILLYAVHAHAEEMRASVVSEIAPMLNVPLEDLQRLWMDVRLCAEGSDWKRIDGEELYEWAWRKLRAAR